jgi:antitoxin component of MazEF toxin-antitoxin module
MEDLETLEELVAMITPENMPEDIDFGLPVGQEQPV